MQDQLYRMPAWLKSHTKDSDSFFGALGFSMPVEELTLRTASLTDILCWLSQPQGLHLVDGTSTGNPVTALAILLTPEVLYDPDSPKVGLGLMYKAPYIQTTSWTEAYFNLKLASQAEASCRTMEAKVIFVQIQVSSRVIPLPGVLTLFLDVKSPEDITDSKVARPPQDFRGFWLHEVTLKGDDPPTSQVAFPHLQGTTACNWTLRQRQVLPPELEESPQITVALSPADSDSVYPSCLDAFKARHKASLTSEAASSIGGASSRGESSTPTRESPFVTWPQLPLTPTLERQEVDARVAEVLDQVHNLHLSQRMVGSNQRY